MTTPSAPRLEAATEDRWSHNQAIVNDIRLHYVEAGPEDGPTVILLHGFPEFWYSWRHQILGLADAGYHVIAPDMRGYNRSEKPHGTEAYHIDHLTADIADLIENVSDGPAHIVGHDWGGAVAWATAMDHPSVVDRLVILNAPHPAKFARELSLEQVKRSWYIYLFQLPWLPEWLFAAREYRALEEIFTETATDGAFTDEDIARYKTAFRQPGSLTSAVNYYRNLLSPEQATDILANIPLIGDQLAGPVPQITAPTLVLWGEDDTALTVEQSEGLERYVTDVRVERFPEATHWIQVDIPDQVLEELTAFLGPDN